MNLSILTYFLGSFYIIKNIFSFSYNTTNYLYKENLINFPESKFEKINEVIYSSIHCVLISFLRLDAGLPCAAIRYVLTALYPRVSPGGIVYIDGYVSSGCDMQSFHGASILPVVETGGKHHAVWWSKFVGPKRY